MPSIMVRSWRIRLSRIQARDWTGQIAGRKSHSGASGATSKPSSRAATAKDRARASSVLTGTSPAFCSRILPKKRASLEVPSHE